MYYVRTDANINLQKESERFIIIIIVLRKNIEQSKRSVRDECISSKLRKLFFEVSVDQFR